MLKQLDIYRRESVDLIVKGTKQKNPKLVAEGLKNITMLAFALMLMGIPTDMLKAFILNKEYTLDDAVVDNIFKVMGSSRYMATKGAREGYATAIVENALIPAPVTIVDKAIQDIGDVISGDKDIQDVKSLRHVPVIGNIYFHWWGGGADD